MASKEYEVDKILDKRIRYNKPEYYLSWKGYGPEEYCWIPEKHLNHCSQMVKKFERTRSRSTSPKKVAKREEKKSPVRRKSSSARRSPAKQPASRSRSQSRGRKPEPPVGKASPRARSSSRGRSRTPTRIPKKTPAAKPTKTPSSLKKAFASPIEAVKSALPVLRRRASKSAERRQEVPKRSSSRLTSQASSAVSPRSILNERPNHTAKPRFAGSFSPARKWRNWKWPSFYLRRCPFHVKDIPIVIFVLMLLVMAATLIYYKREYIFIVYDSSRGYIRSWSSKASSSNNNS